MECAVTGLRMESGAVCSVIATSCSFVRYTQQIGHLGQVSKDWDKLFLTLPLFSRYLGANDNWILIPPEAAQNPYCRPSQSFQEPSMMCTTSPARCQETSYNLLIKRYTTQVLNKHFTKKDTRNDQLAHEQSISLILREMQMTNHNEVSFHIHSNSWN